MKSLLGLDPHFHDFILSELKLHKGKPIQDVLAEVLQKYARVSIERDAMRVELCKLEKKLLEVSSKAVKKGSKRRG